MTFGTRSVGLLGLALVLGGCGGAAPPAAIEPQAVAEEDLPAWVTDLPEGELPRDNDQTDQAALALFQASSSDDPAAYQRALDAAQAGIQLDATNPQSYLQAGQAYLGLGDYEAADEMFDQAEQLRPRYAYEIQFYREGEWIENYNEAVTNLPDNMDAAVASLQRAHSIYQGRPEAMIQLGALYAQTDRLEEAADMFGQAIAMMEDPERVERIDDPELVASFPENLEISRFQRGQALFELERFREAADAYRGIVEANPDDLMAYSNLGASLVAAGDTQGAAEVYDDLLARPGLGVRDYNQIAVGAYNGDLFDQAAAAFGRAAELLPENRDFLFNQAQSLYLAQGEAADPAPIAERLVAVATDLVEIDTHTQLAYRFLAQGMIGLGQNQEAVGVLEEMEALPFDLGSLQLTQIQGGYVVNGTISNVNMASGASAQVRFRFYDEAGMEVGNQTVTLTVDEVDTEVPFEVQFPTDVEILGFNYVVL